MSAPYRDGEDWLIAGYYCEHQSLGHTCQDCRDTVVDVLCALRDARFVIVPPSPNARAVSPGEHAEIRAAAATNESLGTVRFANQSQNVIASKGDSR